MRSAAHRMCCPRRATNGNMLSRSCVTLRLFTAIKKSEPRCLNTRSCSNARWEIPPMWFKKKCTPFLIKATVPSHCAPKARRVWFAPCWSMVYTMTHCRSKPFISLLATVTKSLRQGGFGNFTSSASNASGRQCPQRMPRLSLLQKPCL